MGTSRYAAMSKVLRLLRRIWNAIARHLGPRVDSVQTLSEQDFLELFSFTAGAEHFDPAGRDAVADLMRHFGQRIASDWPTIPDVITDLRIDLSRMSDEEVIQRAEEALDGDLHPSGLRPQFTEQGALDWSFNPAQSREWLLMLHRHAWWVLWGAAYQRTGDEKFARAFVAQLLDWINKNPLPRHKSEYMASWRLMETGLRMRISWIPSFGCFYKSEAFNDTAKLKMLRAIYDHGQFLHRFHTNRNHLLRESNGLLGLGLCFAEYNNSSEWVDSAMNRLEAEIKSQVNSDGSHIEMSVGYQWLTVVEFEVTRSLLHQYRRVSAIKDLDGTLHRMYEFLAAVIRPDKTFPQLNDGFILWDAAQLAEIGKQRGWSDIEYAGSAGESGSVPDYCSRSFPNAGLHVMRSGWTPGARYLVADTGPYGGPHGHEDKLSFELYAYGAQFIIDPGSYTYDGNDPFRNYFVGSQGHNTALVDHGSQVRRWTSRHMTPAVENVVHGAWRSDNELDVVSGQYDEGYAPFSINKPADQKVTRDVTHRRDFVFAKPKYWIIADCLHSRDLHQYTFLFHLAPGVVIDKLTGTSAVVRASSNGALLVIKALSGHELTSEVIEGAESPPQGWYSEDHHKKCSSPVLSFSIASARSPIVAWLLYPLPPGSDVTKISATMQFENEAGSMEIRVKYGERFDCVRLPDCANAKLDGESTRAFRVSLERRTGANKK